MNWPRTQAMPYRQDASPYFECVRDLDWPVWLDSGHPAYQGGRYEVISAAPIEKIRVSEGQSSEVLQNLRGVLSRDVHTDPRFPFCGGLIGFVSYELGRLWHGLPARRDERLADDLCVGLYDWALIVDHQLRSASLIGLGLDHGPGEKWRALCERFARVSSVEVPESRPARLLSEGLSGQPYREGFERIQRYIREGDIYQVNYTRRLQAESDEDAWSLYQRLRKVSPAPYGAFLDFGDYQVLSDSPEQFLSLEGDRVRTRPIKGTRPRSDSPVRDAQLRAELASSEKDRAENLMIVDLMRNDLGRVCEPGSIQVPELFAVESFAKVHHLVSTVTGVLRAGMDALDLLYACFPGGSITGAPKRRAMQIIDELEPVNRELYCGSVFRLGFDGRLDSSIAIRTVLRRDGRLSYWTGGGIVADSDVDAEFEETRDKAKAFIDLIGV